MVQSFIKLFHEEKDANARANLLTTFTHNGMQKVSLQLMLPAMKDSSPRVRQAAVSLLQYHGANSKEGYEVFKVGLKDTDHSVRVQAAHSAGYYGDKAWDPLAAALQSAKDVDFRHALLQNMQSTGFRSKAGVPALIDCVKESNASIRQLACNVLANIGPDAAAAIPELRKIADDAESEPNVLTAARNALQRIERKK